MPTNPNTIPERTFTRPARQCPTSPNPEAPATMSNEVVVAAAGVWPAAYTRTGTARIDPPPPSAPRANPIKKPSGEATRPFILDPSVLRVGSFDRR